MTAQRKGNTDYSARVQTYATLALTLGRAETRRARREPKTHKVNSQRSFQFHNHLHLHDPISAGTAHNTRRIATNECRSDACRSTSEASIRALLCYYTASTASVTTMKSASCWYGTRCTGWRWRKRGERKGTISQAPFHVLCSLATAAVMRKNTQSGHISVDGRLTDARGGADQRTNK